MDSGTQLDYDQAFDRVIKCDGGILDTSGFRPDLQELFRSHLEGAQQWINVKRDSRQTAALGTMPYVHFGFIDNPIINAVALRNENGQAFIGINVGAVFLLIDLFYRMLAHPGIFDWVGNTAVETDPEPSLPHLFYNFSDLLGMFDRGIAQQRSPKDVTRQIYANTLLGYALKFLVAHELAHHRNGHVLLAQSKNGKQALAELYFDNQSPLDHLSKQALEMDADAWATVQCMAEVPVERESRVNPTLLTLAIAIYTVFRVFIENGDGLSDLSLSHPPPRLRQSMIGATAFAVLERDRDRGFAEMQIEAFVKATLYVEKAIELITGEKANPDAIMEAFGPQGTQYLMQLKAHWTNVVRPKLVPLTHSSTLVP